MPAAARPLPSCVALLEWVARPPFVDEPLEESAVGLLPFPYDPSSVIAGTEYVMTEQVVLVYSR